MHLKRALLILRSSFSLSYSLQIVVFTLLLLLLLPSPLLPITSFLFVLYLSTLFAALSLSLFAFTLCVPFASASLWPHSSLVSFVCRLIFSVVRCHSSLYSPRGSGSGNFLSARDKQFWSHAMMVGVFGLALVRQGLLK